MPQHAVAQMDTLITELLMLNVQNVITFVKHVQEYQHNVLHVLITE